jgi:hypothetical protein
MALVYRAAGSTFCFVVVVLVLLGNWSVNRPYMIRQDQTCSDTIKLDLKFNCPAVLPGSLARQSCPAVLSGSLDRQSCPAVLPGSLVRQS